MATVQPGIIEGTRIRTQDGVVTEYVDTYIVDTDAPGFDQPQGPTLGTSQIANLFHDAFDATPRDGSEHPTYTDLVVREKSAVALDDRLVQLDVVYRFPDATSPGFDTAIPELSGGINLEQVEEATTIAGLQLRVGTPAGETQGGVATVLRPVGDLQASIPLISNDPHAVARSWLNTVNDGPWPGDGISGARTWLIAAVPFTLVQEQYHFQYALFKFTWHFRYRPDGWDPVIYYVDPDTGQPPEGLLTAGQTNLVPGIDRPEQYPETNFMALPFF